MIITYISTGIAYLDNVELKRMGQYGWTESYDPRYSLAFVNAAEGIESSLNGCSFNMNFNGAIGLFNTHSVSVTNNVVYHTVGTGNIFFLFTMFL